MSVDPGPPNAPPPVLFLDIEAGCPEWDVDRVHDYVRRCVPKTHKKPDTIEKWIAENGDEAWAGVATDPDHARLVCIGVAFDDDEPFAIGPHDDEAETLREFQARLVEHKAGRAVWVGCHHRGLDLHLLKRRAARYGLDGLARAIPWKRYSKRIADVAELWVAPRPGSFVSQDAIAEALGLPIRPGDEIDGAQVPAAWAAGDVAPILRHVLGDVVRLRSIYRRMESCGFLEAL